MWLVSIKDGFYYGKTVGDRLKKLLALLALVFCCLMILQAPRAYALEIEATSAILIDADSGRVLFEQNAHQSLPVASLTKILTALLTLEHFDDLHQTFTLPADFKNVGESSINLAPGETLTIEDLLYALMLRSANDAAQALAIAVAGSESAFADLMNQRTTELGLTESHWVNPHGLHDDAHYSSAYDLACITRTAMRIPMFNTLISTRTHTIPWAGQEDDRVVSNHNSLLTQYEGADGVKTGYTSKAGNCLVGSATRDGLRLIGVVLNCEDTYGQMKVLLDYGFDHYELRQVAAFGDTAARIPVVAGRADSVNVIYGDNVRLLLPKGEEYTLEPTLDLPERLVTPVDSQVVVGQALFSDGAGNVTKADLYPADDLESFTLWGLVRTAFTRILQVLLV